MSNDVDEPEFNQILADFKSALSPQQSTLLALRPEYQTAMDIIVVPERVVQFRVTWEDDSQTVQVNNGYRVQFNSALGPYKGGTRFHPSVNLSVCKFLAWEQMCKNALTGLNIGGAKGGSDFDPKGKSDHEICRFCIAYMRALRRHIGADIDIPAGDIGVGRREVGWMFGAYKAETSMWNGSITSKGDAWGGSLMKLESTGYGLIYYLTHMIKYTSNGTDTLRGKAVAISGLGNVAQHAARKAIELGATVMSLSDSKGAFVAKTEQGISPGDVSRIIESKARRQPWTGVAFDADNGGVTSFDYLVGERPWKHVRRVTIALPCATQNELLGDDATALIAAGCKFVAEGSNMGCSQEAIDLFERHRREKGKDAIWFAPGKAANIGGSAVSGFEMAQNSQRTKWTAEQVNEKLEQMMKACFDLGVDTAVKYTTMGKGEKPNLIAGSNIAAFIKLADAMRDQGDWW